MRAGRWCSLWLGVVASQMSFGQVPNLLAFQQKIASAFNTSGKMPAYAELSGSASWVAGSQNDSGTISVQIAADGRTGETWSFSNISHTYTQSATDLAGFARTCTYTDGNQKQQTTSWLDCQRGVPWFLPSFALQPGFNAAVTVSNLTDVSDVASGLVKLRYASTLTMPGNASKAASEGIARVQTGTAVTVYYDAQTALPSKLVYATALDDDASRSIETAVQFSDYRNESGYMIPHHIQRFLQRTLQVDWTVSSVTIR